MAVEATSHCQGSRTIVRQRTEADKTTAAPRMAPPLQIRRLRCSFQY